MTGPEHYLEAERLLGVADRWEEEEGRPAFHIRSAAQAHATLALTAATAMDSDPDTVNAWYRAGAW